MDNSQEKRTTKTTTTANGENWTEKMTLIFLGRPDGSAPPSYSDQLRGIFSWCGVSRARADGKLVQCT